MYKLLAGAPAFSVLIIGLLWNVQCVPLPQSQVRDGGSFTSDILRALQRRSGLTPNLDGGDRYNSNSQTENNARRNYATKPNLSARALLPQQAYGGGASGGRGLVPRQAYGNGGGGGYDDGAQHNPPQEYLFYSYPRAQTAYAALSQAAKPIPQVYNPCLYYLVDFNQTAFGLNGKCGDPLPYNLTSQRPLAPRSDLFGYPNYYIPKHFVPLGYGATSNTDGTANTGSGGAGYGAANTGSGGVGYGTYEGGGYGNGTKEKKLYFFNYPPKPEYREPEADIYGYPASVGIKQLAKTAAKNRHIFSICRLRYSETLSVGTYMFFTTKTHTGYYIPKIFVPHGFGVTDDGSFANSQNYSSSAYGGGYGNVPARQGSIGYGSGGGYGGGSAGYGGGYNGAGAYGGGNAAGYGGGGGGYTGGGYGNRGYGSIPAGQMGKKK